ncbi:helix-turn-helix domain-containing protein [Francisella philomiragia]|uniref:Helix-turn-helix family protein n=1 Tax=Francisella philomiragia TaxID=28110 RepID=A0A0B6D8K0_9GAMM|nr:helix-turn-helix transcriptional regulator [Francisella philomiragia]AJI53928.1 helix-turn-helix family protein [Francisella philomiragia]MBY7733595.1 helix-turn-helix transcriptional regulator [Francisella philomiragia]
MAIRVNLAKIMIEKQIKSKDLAKAIGITEQNLSILKNEKAKAIRFSTLEAICKYLDCQPGDILVHQD